MNGGGPCAPESKYFCTWAAVVPFFTRISAMKCKVSEALRTRTVPLAASVPGVTKRSLLVTFTVAL